MQARKITKKRLTNIALYYLKRFESSVENLRSVLRRRTDKYAFLEPDFNKEEAYQWIEEIVDDFSKRKYVDDERFADFKIKSYLNSGKPARYIKNKMKQKGIDDALIENILEKQEYNPFEMALKFAKKKKLGPFRSNKEERKEFRQKDMQKLVMAGFDYDTTIQVMEYSED